MSNVVLRLSDPAAASKRLQQNPAYQAVQAKHEHEHERIIKRLRAKVLTRPQTMRTRKWLSATFPACFASFGADKRPLKIHIDADISERCFNIKTSFGAILALENALRDYCRGERYLASVVAGAIRVDLDGNPAGVVTERDAEISAKWLARLRAQKAELAKMESKS